MERGMMIIRNKKANYEYFIIEDYTAGIILAGTEVKSIRKGDINLSDSYCQFKNGELYIINMHISEYKDGTYNNHEPKRDRKLLLTKRELKRLKTKSEEKGLTIIPKSLFFQKQLVKVDIALAKGKKLWDKRESIKQKDNERDMEKD